MTRVDALSLLSTGHLLRILIPLEEPPHLTADNSNHYLRHPKQPDYQLLFLVAVGSNTIAIGTYKPVS